MSSRSPDARLTFATLRYLQVQSKDATNSEFTAHGDLSTHSVDDISGQCQPQARAVNLRCTHPGAAIKGFKDSRNFRVIHAYAMVSNTDANFPAAALRRAQERSRDAYRATGTTILYGIYHDILESLRKG
jgi:hypothetical protein